MLRKRVIGFVCVAGGLATALAVAFASSGGAASKNICAVPSMGTPLSPASCLKELVAPHFISPGSNALSVTKFINESGTPGATATHVVLSVTFPTLDVTIVSVNGVSLASSGCGSSAASEKTTVTCSIGNVAGGGIARMIVRFATSTSMRLTGTATYGEGTGTPGAPPNSVQVNSDDLTFSSTGSAGGGCFDLTGANTQMVTGVLGGQTTQATVGPGAGDLPCTFADAGVQSNAASALALRTQISFFEFPTFVSGYATVKMLVTPLPPGVNANKANILEDTSYTPPLFRTYVTVPNCDKSGNILPPVGVPAPGATDSTPHSNDLCIFNRSPLPAGGGEFDFHAFGSPADGHLGF